MITTAIALWAGLTLGNFLVQAMKQEKKLGNSNRKKLFPSRGSGHVPLMPRSSRHAIKNYPDPFGHVRAGFLFAKILTDQLFHVLNQLLALVHLETGSDFLLNAVLPMNNQLNGMVARMLGKNLPHFFGNRVINRFFDFN